MLVFSSRKAEGFFFFFFSSFEAIWFYCYELFIVYISIMSWMLKKNSP